MNTKAIVYSGISIMVIALILIMTATALMASLDKYSKIPESYLNLVYAGVLIFVVGLALCLLGSVNLM